MRMQNFCIIGTLVFLICLSVHATGGRLKFYNEGHFAKNLYKNGNQPIPTDVKVEYYEQQIDHFSFVKHETFHQRYLIYDKYWKSSGGPIFFYTGNEGDIVWFMNNTGLMFDWAPQFGALLMFAEHRYYGKSLSYGDESYKDLEHLGYLTSEQALADFVTLIDHLKSTMEGASTSPVVAFGGSYGGMLAAWLRIKYPRSVVGALSASAPIWSFEDLTPCNGFMSVVTEDFKSADKNCAENIRKSWDVILKLSETAEGRASLTTQFQLCESLRSGAEMVEWLNTAWVYMAMVDYPYPAEFLNPLPAWPVKVTCGYLNKTYHADRELLSALKQAVNVFYNFTGSVKCFSFNNTSTPDLGVRGWNFQACSEMVMPMCSDGVHDMFLPSVWNVTEYAKSCKKQYGVDARPHWIVQEYNGKNIDTASNIIFSNGRLDPWSAGGVLKSLSPSLVAILIEDGAHHLDLRSATPSDPTSVVQARLMEKEIIEGWIQQHHYQTTQHMHAAEEYLSLDCHRNSLQNCSPKKEDQLDSNDNHVMAVTGRFLFCSILALLFFILVFFISFTASNKTPFVSTKSDSKYSSVDQLTSL